MSLWLCVYIEKGKQAASEAGLWTQWRGGSSRVLEAVSYCLTWNKPAAALQLDLGCSLLQGAHTNMSGFTFYISRPTQEFTKILTPSP